MRVQAQPFSETFSSEIIRKFECNKNNHAADEMQYLDKLKSSIYKFISQNKPLYLQELHAHSIHF